MVLGHLIIKMKLDLDSDELNANTDPEELTGLSHVLRAFLDFVHKLQNQSEVPPEALPPKVKPPQVAVQPESAELPSDPFGDIIIQKLKRAQAQASRPARRASGWMNIGFPRETPNDRHI